MNRSFIAELTPSSARIICMMKKYNLNLVVDPIIEKMCNTDILPDHYVLDDLEREMAQFIVDMNFRVGLPIISSLSGQKQKMINSVKAALDFANITSDQTVVIDTSISAGLFPEFEQIGMDYDAILPNRNKILLINVDCIDHGVGIEIISKMFRRIIVYGVTTLQYSFSYGKTSSSITVMGRLLYPTVEKSFENTTYSKISEKSMIAMGVFPNIAKFNQSIST